MTKTDTNALIAELEKILPLIEQLETGRDCEEYAFAKSSCFQAMTYAPEAFEALRCIPEAAAELSRLQAEVERLTLDGIHTCHDQCQRPVCVLRREKEALQARVEALETLLRRTEMMPIPYPKWRSDVRQALTTEPST